MEDYTEVLMAQLSEINKYIAAAEKKLSGYKSCPDGCVKVSYSNGNEQYYIKHNGEKQYKYVQVADMKEVRLIVQHDYDVNVYAKLLESRKALSSFLNRYHIDEVENAYNKLALGRRKLVAPLIPPADRLIEMWQNRFKTGQNGFQDERRFKTEKGEMVRSKSEKIIADMFYRYNVPYVYEPLLGLGNKQIVFPDFALLNVRKQKTVYWEHFGLIDDADYAIKSMNKLYQYEKNGIMCGDNLVISIESQDSPLDIHSIEMKIKSHLL